MHSLENALLMIAKTPWESEQEARDWLTSLASMSHFGYVPAEGIEDGGSELSGIEKFNEWIGEEHDRRHGIPKAKYEDE